MTTRTEAITDVIDAMYEALFAGDIDAALSKCAPDALWHGVTPAPVSGSHPMRTYLERILPEAIEAMTGWAMLEVQRDTFDELVVARMRTTHGAGLMIFRVADGSITDIWVINNQGRNARLFF